LRTVRLIGRECCHVTLISRRFTLFRINCTTASSEAPG
jgi:hypothetical protein